MQVGDASQHLDLDSGVVGGFAKDKDLQLEREASLGECPDNKAEHVKACPL